MVLPFLPDDPTAQSHPSISRDIFASHPVFVRLPPPPRRAPAHSYSATILPPPTSTRAPSAQSRVPPQGRASNYSQSSTAPVLHSASPPPRIPPPSKGSPVP